MYILLVWLQSICYSLWESGGMARTLLVGFLISKVVKVVIIFMAQLARMYALLQKTSFLSIKQKRHGPCMRVLFQR
ncbi:hypothetical protein EDC04DRAFT_2655715 [Pisolithus marmoratus]|nr:hypothetical protein EDC04DRAFT_2655715 [Pisolithus marmoratus]